MEKAPLSAASGAVNKRIIWLFAGFILHPKKRSQNASPTHQNLSPKRMQIQRKINDMLVLEPVPKMYQRNSKNSSLENLKMWCSLEKGCIFQGFQHLQKSVKNHSQSVPKWDKKCGKAKSVVLPELQLKNMLWQSANMFETWSQNEAPEIDFLMIFEELGSRVPQGGPKDPPRIQKAIPKLQKVI